jgi:DNA mismatch repair protein MutS
MTLLLQIKDDILNTNIDTLTPVEALLKLHEIKKFWKKVVVPVEDVFNNFF